MVLNQCYKTTAEKTRVQVPRLLTPDGNEKVNESGNHLWFWIFHEVAIAYETRIMKRQLRTKEKLRATVMPFS